MTKRAAQPASSRPLFSPEKDVAMIGEAIDKLIQKYQAKTPEKLPKLVRFLGSKRFETHLGKVVANVSSSAGKRIAKQLKADAPGMFQWHRPMLSEFEERLRITWKKPFDLLEMLWVAASETGELMSKGWEWDQSPDEDLVFDVLRRLHARGCQVTGEVLALLRSGYASGAHARWRTLHETAVTASFIREHGKDVAERYLAHEYVESHKAIGSYQRYCRLLGYRPYSKKEVQEMAHHRDRVVKTYGDAFAGRYGWAAAALGRSDKRVGFADVETAVKMDHFRPHYQMASHPVHANPKAITFSLGLLTGQDLLLTGPSNLGLADPGQSTAISLMQLTTCLMVTRPSIMGMASVHALQALVDEAQDAFVTTQEAVEKRARGNRSKPRSARSRARTRPRSSTSPR